MTRLMVVQAAIFLLAARALIFALLATARIL
jgi:hypothetical protein